jgi:uncharacterized protein
MIRLTELKLPLDHSPDALPALIAQTLGLTPADVTRFTVFKRSFDARKAQLLQVYMWNWRLPSLQPFSHSL